jgi:hypothetical protein
VDDTGLLRVGTCRTENVLRLAIAAPELRAGDEAGSLARVSLLKKIKLFDDWRDHAWILSHCWPEQFSESRILQPAQSTWM